MRPSLSLSLARNFTFISCNTARAILFSGQVQQIGTSLQNTTNNAEFLATINTAQWLQGAKAIVITGTPENIEKVRELIEQLDTPLRQVYIEMLILQAYNCR